MLLDRKGTPIADVTEEDKAGTPAGNIWVKIYMSSTKMILHNLLARCELRAVTKKNGCLNIPAMPPNSFFQASETVGSTFATQRAQFMDSVPAEFCRAGVMQNVPAFQIPDSRSRMPTSIVTAQHLHQQHLQQSNCS